MKRKEDVCRCRWCGGRVGQEYFQVEGRCYCAGCMELFRRSKEE